MEGTIQTCNAPTNAKNSKHLNLIRRSSCVTGLHKIVYIYCLIYAQPYF